MSTEPAPEHSDPLARRVDGALARVLGVQRPVVLAHLRGIRRRHPLATPEAIERILERRYLAAVTTGGAAVGATAAVPGVGTGAALALTGFETVGFLEASALYAQSVAELHGLAVSDPVRSRALLLSLLAGQAGEELVRQVQGQVAGSSGTAQARWGRMITSTLPRSVLNPLVEQARKRATRYLVGVLGGGAVARLAPFGIGAAVGGTGNYLLARKVIHGARDAFGALPEHYPLELEPAVRSTTRSLPWRRRS